MGHLDAGSTPHRLLTELFPFHLILRFDGEAPTGSCRIVEAGETLADWIGTELDGAPFADRFRVTRPSLPEFTAAALAQRESKVFFLTGPDERHQLRGQFLTVEDGIVLFVGSPVVTAVESMEQLGLSLAAFAPHDATPDILVLGQFSQMQITDLERQTTELRRANAARDKFSERASTDPLTMLANRRAFWEHCAARIRAQHGDGGLILLYIDVDGFKSINDEHGHQVGDRVLQTIGHRLVSAVRGDDLVARLGGDEFAVLLTGVEDSQRVGIVERIRAMMFPPVETDDGLVPVSVSIGAIAVDPEQTLDELVRDSDTAMYRGRDRNGRGQVTWFVERMRDEREERRALLTDLHTALDEDQFSAVFQPIVQLPGAEVVAVEALARWAHPERGQIPPDVFIEVAERAGLVPRLDRLILRSALQQLARWRQRLPDLGLHVNVSGRSIDPTLAGWVGDALVEADVPPAALTIEVTEGWFMEGDEVKTVLTDVVDLGANLHLDDFGTGFSSLAHLQAFPISGLKIDRSFVTQLSDSDRSRRLVAAMISMAASLHLDVIAEGVETERQAEVLSMLGCDLAQGFLYARPAAPTEADRFVDEPAGSLRPDPRPDPRA